MAQGARLSEGRVFFRWMKHQGFILLFFVIFLGCGQRAEIHPGFRAEDKDLDGAASVAQGLIAKGANPLDALTYRVTEVNSRISSESILRAAGMTLPVDRIAYEIAKLGDVSDAGIRRGQEAGLRGTENEIIFVAEVQLPKRRDPAEIKFALRTAGAEYPPIAVDTPVLLREVTAAYTPVAETAALYLYLIHFPVKGGPGYPPIGPSLSSLTLVVQDGSSETTVPFQLPRIETS